MGANKLVVPLAVQVVVILVAMLVVLAVVKTLVMVPIARMGVVVDAAVTVYQVAVLRAIPGVKTTATQLVPKLVLLHVLTLVELAVVLVAAQHVLQQIVKTFPSIGVYK